jgi:DNA (cytosine-5)-methyltransferase 1
MHKIKIEAIDLFCGIGGLTYGLRKAGVKVLAGLDNDNSCAFSYEKNNHSKFIEADISTYDFEKMKSLYSNNSIKVLVGCAPCQPFSSHSFKNKNKEADTRWNLLNYFIKAIEVLKPDIISMENVRGLIKTDVFRNFIDQVERLNYKIDHKIVYCPDYGIPQSRSRLVLLGSKLGKISIPEKSHSKDNYVTVDKIIKNLPKIKSGEVYAKDSLHRAKNLSWLNLERIQQSKPKGTWNDWEENLLPKCYKRLSGKTYTSVYGRMSWNDVSPTITTQFYNYGSGRFGHPEQNRALSLREGALLQTFPPQYNFGYNISLSTVGRQIGNAVPPKLGYIIGKSIKNHLMNIS